MHSGQNFGRKGQEGALLLQLPPGALLEEELHDGSADLQKIEDLSS